MLSALSKTRPQVPLAITFGAGGVAKLAGVPFEKDSFAKWGYSDRWRLAIGAIEVATAGAALLSLRSDNDTARKLVAAGTLSTMGGAIATHVMAGEPAALAVPAAILAALGFATLFQKPVEEPDAS